MGAPEESPQKAIPPTRWKKGTHLSAAGFGLILLAMSIRVVPSGSGGVLVSQISGILPGTLYPGFHFSVPLVQHIELYNLRDNIFNSASVPDLKKGVEVLKVQAK
jgi:hypothetical protein